MDPYFNQIFPLSSSGKEIGGYINVLNEDFYVQIAMVDGPPKQIRLRGTWKLQQLLKPVNKVLEQHLGQCETFPDILQELKSTLEQQLKAEKIKKDLSILPLSYYKKLLEQLESYGWEKVHEINTELNKIKLEVNDSCGRDHILHVILPHNFPKGAPTWEFDVPGTFSFRWSSESTIADLCSNFENFANSYNLFWNCMDEIDNDTWVLEPEKPCRSNCKRRIALASTASLLIIVNPNSPTTVPVCHFLGPERTVGPLREKLNSNIYRWDESDSLLYNLKAIMDMEFPGPMTSEKEDYCVACGICYAYQLGDFIPDISCEDLNCNQPFHNSCLYEWFRSLPTTRHSFNTVFGECPYCSKPLSCTMP